MFALAAISAALFAVAACDNGPTPEDCQVSESVDNMSLDERRDFCGDYEEDPNGYSPPARQEPAPEPELTPEQKFARALDIEQSVEGRYAGQPPAEDTPSDTVRWVYESRQEYFRLFLEAAATLPEAVEDLNRAFGVVSTHAGDNYPAAGYLLPHERLLVAAWEAGSVDQEILRPFLTRVRDRLLGVAREAGYNPAHRYRPWQNRAEGQLFLCTNFGAWSGDIARVLRLIEPASERTRQWRLQAADYPYNEMCEGEGNISTERRQESYDEYVALGYTEDAERIASDFASRYLAWFVDSELTGDRESIEFDFTGYLGEAEVWLERVSETRRQPILARAAEQAEDARKEVIAAYFYERAGDAAAARRMAIIAAGRASS